MKRFEVYEKATGAYIDAYSAPAPIEFAGGEFALYEHREKVEVAPDQPVELAPRWITLLAFKSRMTQAERVGFREAAKVSALVADYLDMLNSVQNQMVNLNEAQIFEGLMAGERAGVLAAGRAQEIMNG